VVLPKLQHALRIADHLLNLAPVADDTGVDHHVVHVVPAITCEHAVVEPAELSCVPALLASTTRLDMLG
jgi:hypothetical protein